VVLYGPLDVQFPAKEDSLAAIDALKNNRRSIAVVLPGKNHLAFSGLFGDGAFSGPDGISPFGAFSGAFSGTDGISPFWPFRAFSGTDGWSEPLK
jgi:hypothetical protein